MNKDDSRGNMPREEEPPSPDGSWISRCFRRFFPPRNGLKDSLEEVIEELEDEESTLGEEERSIIKNTLTFRNKRVEDIMVPRTDIVAVEASSSFEEVMDIFVAGTTSRLPVYRESLDEVIAMVHIKDAFRELVSSRDQLVNNDKIREITLRSIQRPILFVPPSMKLFDLLTKMQSTHIHMALVVDEYGGTDGLLTIEDLVEQIFGDIEDEHDEVAAELLRELPGGNLIADARVTIDDLGALLGLDLLSSGQDDVDTLGGLLFTMAGYIPEVGEVITDQNGLEFEIMAGDGRHIKTILIRRKKRAGRRKTMSSEMETTNDNAETPPSAPPNRGL